VTEHLDLEAAVARHVQTGDTVHLMLGHSRWTAAARELVRQHWGDDLGLTLMMVSLSSLGALFFRGGLVRKVITAYSGDAFPTYSPNPIFQKAYVKGEVEVEHWSILTFAQRLEAAARGLPALVSSSLAGSSMADNDAYVEADTALGRVGLLAPMAPDVTLVHAAVADRAGNVAMHPPMLEGPWGALAARRGVIATVEAVVDDLRPWSHLVRIPSHRVLAVVEAPFGAHPGGVFPGTLPVEGYGEDVEFWTDARAACRGDFDAWARDWCLDVPTQADYLGRLGADRQAWLRGRTNAESWREDEAAHPVDEQRAITGWETAAVFGARELGARIAATQADAVLAGAGVANLAAWVAVADARAKGDDVVLTAELGLWGYTPTLADPYIFNQRSFPSATMLTDASQVLGLLVDDERTRTIGCLGAAQVDRHGNINSTRLDDSHFLVGSGGANDVASRAVECLVITFAEPKRLPADVGYITSPGDRVTTVVTQVGVLRKRDGELCLAALPAGESPINDRVQAAVSACGWELRVDRDVEQLVAPRHDEILALRRYDPEAWFLS
jgi:acyl CoA:acetate/3-ketoacid CoA transferase alpha subunit/acyl CoA:acetate/3-ketoacid CoA transferase beta subunit